MNFFNTRPLYGVSMGKKISQLQVVKDGLQRIMPEWLNYDLFANLCIINSPACECGAQYETAEHFFYFPLYDSSRQTLLTDIQGIMPITTKQ